MRMIYDNPELLRARSVNELEKNARIIKSLMRQDINKLLAGDGRIDDEDLNELCASVDKVIAKYKEFAITRETGYVWPNDKSPGVFLGVL